jgi:hypothetical protein
MDKDSWVRIVIFGFSHAWPKCVFFGHISKTAQSGIAIASGSLAVHATAKNTANCRCAPAGFLLCNCQSSPPYFGHDDQRSTNGENLT